MQVNMSWAARAVRQLHSRAVLVAAGFVVLGMALTGMIVAATMLDVSDTAREVARLGVVLPIFVVCVMAALVVLASRRVRVSSKAFLLVTAAAGAVGNLAIPLMVLGRRAWGSMIVFEPSGAGMDFRAGLYDPAAAFSTAKSSWPPLNLIIGWPFTLVSQDSGYRVQVALLVVLALASVVLSVNLGRRAIVASGGAMAMISVFALWLLTSYGFLFEVERGNLNLYALFFSLLGVWALLRFPRSVWLPAVSLAVAANLKVYPGILLILLFWRHRWRAVLPVVVTNAALMLIAGPGNAWTFVKNSLQLQGSPAPWLGNHSAESFAFCLHRTFPWVPVSMKYLFLAIPIALWLATAVLLIRRGWSQRGAVLLAAASVPLMNTVPAVSHDYKLVLLVFPLAVLGALLVEPGSSRLGLPVWRGTFLGLLGLEMAALSVSTLFWSDGKSYPHAGYGNKYPLVVFVQLLLLGVVLLVRREDDPERQAATVELEVGQPS